MSKIWVTNESSSFARSFSDWCTKTGKHQFVNSLENDEYDYFRQDSFLRSKEIDIFDPTLPNMVSRSGAELIIHQLPLTPYKSSSNADYALRYNIEGTYYVIEAAKEVGIPLFFITSRNYNSFSLGKMKNIYDITASTVENILDISEVEHMTIVPPILYGPEFDEGISGLIKTSLLNKEQAVIDLDPEILHPFMYIDDFFDAFDVIANNAFDPEYDRLTNSLVEILPSKEEYLTFESIFSILEEQNLFMSFDIKPKHDMYNEYNAENNITTLYGWKPKYDIKNGLDILINNIREKNDSKGTE